MALQIWLPLTKDLRNQGLADVTITNSGATFNSAGKLSGCYYFNTSAYLYENTYNWTNFNTSEFSLCCWYKEPSPVASGNSQIICIGTSSGWNNIRIGLLRRTSNGYPMFSVSDGNNAIQYDFTADNFSLDTWNHIVCTYNNGTIKMYLNGVLHKTFTTTIVPVLNSSQHLGIGAASNGAEKLTGYLNDVRIYDHCLSPLEAKKLSQGLVLHYSLNRGGCGQENLIMNTGAMPVHSSALKGFRASGGTVSHLEYDNLPVGTGVIRVTNTGTSAANVGMAQDGLSGFVAGEKYTESCWVRASATANIYLQPVWISSSQTTGNSAQSVTNGGLGKYFSVGTDWQYIKWEGAVLKGDQATTYSSAYIYALSTPASGWFEVCGMKVEHGDKATTWCPNSSDALATSIGLNDNIEYDCSGFENNGTRIGTFSWTSNTPRYDVSAYFNGSSYIKTSSGELFWSNYEQLTVAAWMNPTITQSGWTGSIGIAHDGSNNKKLFAISNYGGKFTVHTVTGSAWTSTQSTYTCPLNEWHHYAATLDGTTIKMYVDGTLIKTYTVDWGTSTNHDNPQIQVGVDLPGSDELYTGYYSDVRIYATALSANDILDLYKLGGSIDENGTFHTYEYVEG